MRMTQTIRLCQRAAIEMLMKDYLVLLSGEVRMGPGVASRVDVAEIVRKKWAGIGYLGRGQNNGDQSHSNSITGIGGFFRH